MARIMNALIKESAIILAFWMGGWVLFHAGAQGLKSYKESYWQGAIAAKTAYRALSAEEKDAAYRQFMELWQVKPGDEPFREGDYGIHVAYGAQAGGFWFKSNWLLCYVLLAVLRIGLRLRRSSRRGSVSRQPTAAERLSRELRIAAFFVVMAAFWYLVWTLLAPSVYVSYRRFVAHSYEYLWNSRLADFERLARAWPYFLLGYPLGLLLRIVWGVRTAIRKRLGF